jgi:hypothetical protein
MAFVDDLKVTVTTKSKELVKKAKETAEVIQLKTKISAENSKIDDVYKEIGKKYYDEKSATVDETYIPMFERVNTAIEKIEQLKKEIEYISRYKAETQVDEETAEETVKEATEVVEDIVENVEEIKIIEDELEEMAE